MSVIASGIIGGAAGQTLSRYATSAANALIGLGPGVAYRSIGGIVAPCTFSEHHSDTLTITDHPVEIGAQITDHSFVNPITVDIEIAWGAGVYEPLRVIYDKLLKLQSTRQPFKIMTGKRSYDSMLIESIEETTGLDTENVLRVSLRCRQVILVATSTTPLPNAANQANPASTASTQTRGTVQTIPAIPAAGGSAVIGAPI